MCVRVHLSMYIHSFVLGFCSSAYIYSINSTLKDKTFLIDSCVSTVRNNEQFTWLKCQ